MDSISQAALGAAIGIACFGNKEARKAAIAGALVATVPDLDVVLYAFFKSFQMLSIHRGVSHSILFSILGGLLIAFVLSKTKWFGHAGLLKLFWFTWLCLFTHIILDTFTAYGTQLMSPFSDARFGLDSINVVDPLYTLPLIVGIVFSLWKIKKGRIALTFNKWGLIVSSIYLVFTLFNKQHMDTIIKEDLSYHNIAYESLLTMPVGIANINWYGVAKTKDTMYLKQYKLRSINQNTFESFPINEIYLNEIDQSTADKMRWFAKGFYTVEKVHGKVRIYNPC